MARAALPHLQPGAVIINCGSITGLEGSKTLIDYASTKGAIHAFTKSLAQNLADRQIRVNCVAPGPFWTVLQPVSKPAEQVSQHGAKTPMQRPGQPEEVAPAFVFFASEADSSYISARSSHDPGRRNTGRLIFNAFAANANRLEAVHRIKEAIMQDLESQLLGLVEAWSQKFNIPATTMRERLHDVPFVENTIARSRVFRTGLYRKRYPACLCRPVTAGLPHRRMMSS